jgi:trans-aconitate 2-methyltransferase
VADEARFPTREQLQAFVATVMPAAPLRDLPSEQRVPLVQAACDRLAEPAVDFVRLQIEAIRAPTLAGCDDPSVGDHTAGASLGM